MQYSLPLDSVMDGEPDNRFPVNVYHNCGDECECCGVEESVMFGEEDSRSPVFCAKCYFESINSEEGQSHFEYTTYATCKEKHEVAVTLLRSISEEWNTAEHGDVWENDHVEKFASRMSFDELVEELASIAFK